MVTKALSPPIASLVHHLELMMALISNLSSSVTSSRSYPLLAHIIAERKDDASFLT